MWLPKDKSWHAQLLEIMPPLIVSVCAMAAYLPVDCCTGTLQLSLGTSNLLNTSLSRKYHPPNRQTVPGSSGPTSKLNTSSFSV